MCKSTLHRIIYTNKSPLFDKKKSNRKLGLLATLQSKNITDVVSAAHQRVVGII